MPSLRQVLVGIGITAVALVVLPMIPVVQDLPGVKKLK